MNEKQFLAVSIIGLIRLLFVDCNASVAGLPSLDEMAGDWIPMKDVANPPAVRNSNQMLVVDRD